MYNTKDNLNLEKSAVMIRSMTGFGRGDVQIAQRVLTIEIKAVNHRYLDINLRMPRKFNFLEHAIRKQIKDQVSRGKLDIYMNYENATDDQECVVFNAPLAKSYMRYFNEISSVFQLENDIKVSHLTRYPEILKLQEPEDDEQALKDILIAGLDLALNKLNTTRQTEGGLLKNDLLDKLSAMDRAVTAIKVYAPQIVLAYKEKLEARIDELVDLPHIDENRLALEVALFADKTCVDEEIVRLKSHITHMQDTLNEKHAVGRKLDFLSQEMNREANTILSKANAIEVSSIALELKTLIEQIREQIQNIE